jgi:hypothetical protein
MNRNVTNYDLFFSRLTYLLFFIGYFLYFGFFIDYVLFYQEKSSLFVLTSDFLLESINQPGGILIYLGKFFSTFFYYPLAGAVIVSTIIILIVLTISKIIKFLSGKNAKNFPFIIGIVLFYLQTNYHFLVVNNLGLLLQLALFLFLIRYLDSYRGWFVVLIAPLWYFATGSFAWIFSLMLTSYFALRGNIRVYPKIIILWCLNLITIYISKEFLFYQTGKTLLAFPFLELNTESQLVLFLSVAVSLSILPVIARIKFNLAGKFKSFDFRGCLLSTILLTFIFIIVSVLQFDKKAKHYFHVQKLFFQNKYTEVIKYNTANRSTNSLTIFLNNIALCETGMMNDLLFHFLQSPDGKTLFLKWERVGEILKQGGYFYYTIGMPNEAHRWAFENMVMKGYSPEDMKMLIKTDLINGNYDIAAKYITILKKTFFYKGEAKTFEGLLFNDDAINADPELGEKRKNSIRSDFFSITDDPYINIERILVNDSLNKKAFEYKLAFMLINKNYKGIEHELPKLSSFGFTRIPTHIEEAAVALKVLKLGELPDLGDLQLNKNTELRWSRFLNIFQQYGTDPRAAEPALRNQFGNTFWYYAFYR